MAPLNEKEIPTMKKLLTLTLVLATLALPGTGIMNQAQTTILNTGYNQWSRQSLPTNFPNRQPARAQTALPNFDYNFDTLVNNQTIFGQDKWVNAVVGNVAVRKGSGINQTQTAKGEGGSAGSGARRPLDNAFYYTAKDTKVVWGVWGYVPSGGNNVTAIGGLYPFYFGPHQLGGLTQLTTYLPRQAPLTYVTGDVLLHDHWYEYRVIVDFSVSGGSATLSYRDVTSGATAFTNDSIIKNVNLGLVPDGLGRYGFSEVIIRNDGAGYVDNLHFDAPAPSTPQKKGMTWFHMASDTQYGTITVGCGASGTDRCDPAKGDTVCSQQLPVLCIYKPNPAFQKPVGLKIPNEYMEWSGGVVATTPPVAGDTFKDKDITAVNAYCQAQFGKGWRAAEFHDGRYWFFQAYGGTVSAPTVPSTRFWVHINDQKDGNCWKLR
jgi:hypothetical protein